MPRGRPRKNPDWAPQRDSLAHRLCSFFLRNPDEELTRDDIASKFDVAYRSLVPDLLAEAVAAGLLSKRPHDEAGWAWGPGRNIEKLRKAFGEPVAKTTKTGSKYGEKLDMHAIALRESPTPPQHRPRPLRNDWTVLFERMKPLQETEPLNATYKFRLQKVMTQYKKDHPGVDFSLHVLDEKRILVRRVA